MEQNNEIVEDFISNLNRDWRLALEEEFKKEYFKDLTQFVCNEYERNQVFPPKNHIFEAFNVTPISNIKVVLLGQDPYHNENQAHGLCFSVQPKVAIPPSLVNIYKELSDDCGCRIPNHGYLKKWANQGVFMLNTVLSVRAHEPNSHKNQGWETFTDDVIRMINKIDRPIVFLLWGKPAQMKKKLLNNPLHLVLEAPHPSPLSAYRGFFGSKPFSKANEFLIEQKSSSIDWQIEDLAESK